MAVSVTDFWGDSHLYADTLTEHDHETHSELLDSKGNPMKYEESKLPIGFDLRGKVSSK